MLNNGNYDKIIVRDLCVTMSAGIYDHEKENTQRVIINYELTVMSAEAVDTINDVVSYEDIVNQTIVLCHAQHYDLLETLAQDLMTLCMGHKAVYSVVIRLEKPDIIDCVTSVGIEVGRTRQNH